MGARTPRVAAGVSSRARSVESYYPFYPPPLYPEGLERGGYSYTNNPPYSVDERSNGGIPQGVVSARWMRQGEHNKFTWGGLLMSVFRMRATGQVESSQANPVLNFPHLVQQNDWLYRAAKGYPRNLGLSEKVPTLPDQALNGTNAGTMRPRPQFRRNIFTSRNYGPPPAIPAQPQAR